MAAPSPHPKYLGGSHRPSDLFLVPPETEACYPRPAEGIKKAKICKEKSEYLITHTDCPGLPSQSPCLFQVPESSGCSSCSSSPPFSPPARPPGLLLRTPSSVPFSPYFLHELMHSQTSTCPAWTCLLGPLETSTWTSLSTSNPGCGKLKVFIQPHLLLCL